ncbi:MAG: RNA pyrophosphohydrolase [Pseudomonadota bacterium]
MPDRNLPYRANVGIMVLNAQGKVWIGHRSETIGTEYETQAQLWQMPQGGIDEGEDAEAAARRELYEETGMSSLVPLDRTEDWIKYDFPAGLTKKISEKYRGQKQMWFVYRFTGPESEIRIAPPPDGHKAEFDDWRWEDMAKLPDMIVPFKREVYDQVIARFHKWADSG